jgi:surface polysaccharide O-acyltransferase-like enzyme
MHLVDSRLFFIDNVRVLLILVVIAFHAAAPYAKVPWYGLQVETTEGTEFVLAWFLTGSVAFFLSLFFMISGYFTPGSYDRKGLNLFLKDRFVRLGIPFAGVSLVIMPFFMYVLYMMQGNHISLIQYMTSVYHWETHHLWFVENLLIFTSVYVVWRVFVNTAPRLLIPKTIHIAAVVVVVAGVTFVVRIWFPIGWWDPFKLIQPAYLPHYVSLFCIGVLAYRNNWLDTLPFSVGVTWLCIGVGTVLLFPLVYIVSEGTYALLTGGSSWQPFVFAVWETVVCFGMCIGLVIFFREKGALHNRLLTLLGANVYPVYVIHLPVVVLLQYGLADVELHPFIKVILVTAGGIFLSFSASYYGRRLLAVRRSV